MAVCVFESFRVSEVLEPAGRFLVSNELGKADERDRDAAEVGNRAIRPSLVKGHTIDG